MDPVLARPLPAEAVRSRRQVRTHAPGRLRTRLLRAAIAAGMLALLAVVLLLEIRASRLQAALFAAVDRRMSYALEPGSAPRPLRVPPEGPYDARLGYSHLSRFGARLTSAGYAVDAQARPSPWLTHATAWGLFPPYREKGPAGLEITDRAGRTLYEARFPERT